jgi:hypothetical protein
MVEEKCTIVLAYVTYQSLSCRIWRQLGFDSVSIELQVV